MDATTTRPAAAPRSEFARSFFGRLLRNPVGFLGFVLALFVIMAAALGPLIAPYDPLAQSIRDRFQGPSAAHWLGTDNFGRGHAIARSPRLPHLYQR